MFKISVLLIMLTTSVFAKNTVYFSPNGGCEENVVKMIDNTQNNLDVAVYSINNDKIVKALINAQNRGVNVRILTDKTQASGPSSKVIDLYNAGLDIKVHTKFKIEHNKFAIYDNENVSTGSFNWTNPAENKNSENCIFFNYDDGGVDDYIEHFKYLWKINSKNKSDEWFKKRFKDHKE